MRKLLLSTLFALCAVISTQAETKFWNFSDKEFNALGDIATDTIVSELAIFGANGTLTVDSNKKAIDDYSFTHRMKMGGSGFEKGGDAAVPTKRYLSFDVAGDATITIYGMSGSSSADRTVIVSNGTKIIGEPTLLGASITKQTVTYTGPATTLYIYSRDSGINFYAIETKDGNEEGGKDPIAQDVFWNFSDDDFNALGDIATDTIVSELAIFGANGTLTVDSNKKAIDDYSFTHRMKMGGSGFEKGEDAAVPTKRYLSFDVAGDATITIYGMSGSSGADRTVIVSNGTKIIGEPTLLGASITKQTVTYTGPATTLYIYSRDSGINFYAIGVSYDTNSDGSNISLPNTEHKMVKSVLYYDVTGRMIPSTYNGIMIEKTTYEDGSSSTKKIIKTQY